jgi:tellurium resistance protein TerD
VTKQVLSLKSIFVALGWDAEETPGVDFDLNISVFLLQKNGLVGCDEDFIFYGNLRSQDGSVEHSGDSLTGGSGGDDEVIKVDLEKVDGSIQKLAITVSIYEAQERRQNFGMVSNAFVRIVNQVDGQEMTRFDLSDDMSEETAMIFGEIYRCEGEWKFKAIGQGFVGGLAAMATHFGVDVE